MKEQTSTTAAQRTRGGQTPLFLKTALIFFAMLALSFSMRAQTFDPHFTGPYDTIHGKFFVRLFVVYWQSETHNWADSLGETELRRRTTRTFSLLNSVFNSNDIFFIPGENEPGTCHTVLTRDYNAESPVYPGGLMMYVFSDDNGGSAHATGQVISTGLPAKSFWIRGREGDDPGSNLPVVIHEIGHCFGLAHTFANTDASHVYTGPGASCSAPSGCQTGYGSLSDQCCGDMVGDTPKHGISTSIVISGDCQTSTTPTDISPAIFRNYMSSSHPNRCRDHFTEQQVRRMRLYLNNSTLLDSVQVAPETIATDTVIWNTVTSKSATIIVPDGAVLVVDSVLEMAPGTYIVVRRGGTLIVNGRITAGCGGIWGGIVVEGDNAYAQKESNGQPSNAQGRVVLNTTGIVEHALSGVTAAGFEYPEQSDYGGGIVEVYGRIRNCTQSLFLKSYRRDSLPNAGKASGAFFTLDNDYRGDVSMQPVLMKLRSINRLDISNSWFFDTRTQNCSGRLSRAKGIEADNAAFRVRSSYFRYLDRGILSHPMGQAGGKGAYEVENSSFFDCYTGIESNLPDNFRIVGNNFYVARPLMCPQESVDFTGVRLFGYALPLGISLADNYFYGGDVEADSYYGIDCAGTGSMENSIRHNTYGDLDVGNNASGNNGGFKGLRYECNEHTDNRFAHSVLTGGSVRNVQGDVNASFSTSTAAGNRFSGNGYTWFNDGAPITYFFWDTIGQVLTTGDGFSGVDTARATFPNPNCSTYQEDCPPPCTVTEVPHPWKDTFFLHQTAWLDAKAEYDTLTDVEEQAALLPVLNTHRSAMDYWGGRVIRDFALDSTGTHIDSVLLWTRHLRAYETDLRLARHTFFTGDLEGYDAWLDSIPARNDLSEAQTDELAEFTDVLAVVRPYAETENDLHRLPATALDSLEAWASNCNEPGFLARVLLLGNGREAIPNCGGGSLRPAQTLANQQPKKSAVRIFPNPTTGRFFVELPADSAPVRVLLHTPDGRTVFDQILMTSSSLDGSTLRPGLYFCRIIDASGLRLASKLIITR